eukprot:XP_011444204.1 PREDICTED: aldose reductase-related protein 2 [Crassostrea gigas]
MDDSLTSVTLSNGLHMPSVGLGTWQSPKDELKVAVRAALDDGYRHIDTAYSYLNEDAIGEVLQEYIKSGKVKREDLFIVTKLAMIHMEPALVKRSIEMSLKKLQLDYVDLYLIHFPVQFAYEGDDEKVFPVTEAGGWKAAEKTDLIGTWKAMEELVDLGLTKSLGLSNCSISQVERICKISKHKPVSNQVECHIYLPQNELFDACKKLGLAVTAYAPFGSPGRFEQLREIDAPVVLEDPVITKIAKRYSKSPAHILLRNLLQRGIIVIPKSVTPHRIRSNIQVFDFSLTKEEMEDIAGIKTKRRLFAAVGLMFPNHPERPW